MVAVVGRPNVGKSTLFNKIIGKRVSIVEDTPGITRDRIYAEAEWCGKQFILIDTGGIEMESDDIILSQMRRQAELAIDMADVTILVVDVREGMTAADAEVAEMLLRSGKTVVVAANKADSPGEPPVSMYEFYNLGLGDPIPVSAIHGMGVGDLLEEVTGFFPKGKDEEEEEDVIRVAVIGKPNAGKSSLINRILGEERLIVSNIAGTTRDAIDSHFEKDGQKYIFIDTAGMRRKAKIADNSVERYSVLRALAAVERADVCVIMIDAEAGISEQDAKIAGFAHDSGKPSVVVVNKWDAIEKDDKTMRAFQRTVDDCLSFMTYAPSVYISAKTGQRVNVLFEKIKYVHEQSTRRVSTGALNDVLNEAVALSAPPSDKGRRLKLYYVTQTGTRPPAFAFFVNDKELAHFSYMRYLENKIRESFGLDGTPIKILVREKERQSQK